MCFYDQYQMACGDFRWGHFRQHCNKEYRTGETCGIKLVMSTIPRSEKCKACTKIETKRARIEKEQDRIHRWELEQKRGHPRGASIEASEQQVAQLEWEIQGLEYQRATPSNMDGDYDRSPTVSSVTTSMAARVPSYGISYTPFHDLARNPESLTKAASSSPIGEMVSPKWSSWKHVGKDVKSSSWQKSSAQTPASGNGLAKHLDKDSEIWISAAPKRPFVSSSPETDTPACHDSGVSGHIFDSSKPIAGKQAAHDKSIEERRYVVQFAEEQLLGNEREVIDGYASDLSTPPTSPKLRYQKTVVVIWRCGCGCKFQETVVEFVPGAANELATASSSGSDVDIEHLAAAPYRSDAVSSSSSPSSESETPSMESVNRHRQSFRTKDEGENTNTQETGDHTRREFVLLCRPAGKETILKQANVTKTPCDKSTYNALHRKHFGRYYRFLKWVHMTEISSVDFTKFHIYWQKYVSIDIKDLGYLPQQPSEEYRYQADTNPPVLKTALRHFIQYPDHAPAIPYHRSRIPKKQRNKLSLQKDFGSQEGYGLYIQESICWMKLFVVEAILATCCVVFAVAWCVINKGGIQDGFAIAGTGIAYLTIILGGLQAVGHRR